MTGTPPGQGAGHPKGSTRQDLRAASQAPRSPGSSHWAHCPTPRPGSGQWLARGSLVTALVCVGLVGPASVSLSLGFWSYTEPLPPAPQLLPDCGLPVSGPGGREEPGVWENCRVPQGNWFSNKTLRKKISYKGQRGWLDSLGCFKGASLKWTWRPVYHGTVA